MDLLKDLQVSLLDFNIVMNYIIHKMLVLIRKNLTYLKNSIFKYFFKEYSRLLLFFKNNFLS